MDIIRSIISNVLTALYEPCGFALILTVLFLFVCMYAREHGWKKIVKKWVNCFWTNREFRIAFFLIFYTAMILFRTLLNRNLWENPLSDVIGIWGLRDRDGKMTTEVIENLVLFIPFSILLLWIRWEKGKRKQVSCKSIVLESGGIVLLFSLVIEFAQLFFRLGTFQLSDLFYNTLGGVIGGLLFYIGMNILVRRNHISGNL